MSFLVASVECAVRRMVVAIERALIEASSSFRDYEAGDYLQGAQCPPSDAPTPRGGDVHEHRTQVAEVRGFGTAEAKHGTRNTR
jgi:hypothetical protein